MSSPIWPVRKTLMQLSTPWFTLIGEQLAAPDQVLDYWRVERADSAVVIPLHRDQILLPAAQYRPGIGTATLDFPGGRVPADTPPEQAARIILQRELGVGEAAIATLTPLNPNGWPINSSFSNQRLYGFVAVLTAESVLPREFPGSTYPCTAPGLAQLRQDLTCLQCRAVLMEWLQAYGDGRQVAGE